MTSHAFGRGGGTARCFDPSALMAAEFDELRKHAQTCQHSSDLLFWSQCAFEKFHAYLKGRIITLLVLAALILLVAE